MIRNFCYCIICHTKISLSNIAKHYNSKLCKSGKKARMKSAIIVPMDIRCTFCKKFCKSKMSFCQHIIRCKDNPKRIDVSYVAKFAPKIPWNKGLTKETSEKIFLATKKLSATSKQLRIRGYKNSTQTQEYWTDERRAQKSQWSKQIIKDKPETHPNRLVANNRSKISYPEQVAFTWLQSNQIEFEHQKQILSYFVDFCVGKKIIEIDGERWHPIGNEKDKIRDDKLSNFGYTVYRIRSKERIEEQLKMIFGV